MTDAQLGEQGINGANLQAWATAAIAQFGSINVVLSIRIEKWQSGKSFDDLLAGTGTNESLEEFLEDQSGGDNYFAAVKGLPQSNNFGRWSTHVTAKR
jgi:hypothetical protein